MTPSFYSEFFIADQKNWEIVAFPWYNPPTMPGILEKINKAVLCFLEPISLEKTYQRIIEEAIKLVNGTDGFILLADEKTGELKYVYKSPTTYPIPQPRRRGHTYRAFKERTAFVVNFSKQPSSHPEVRQSNLRSAIFIPLSYQTKSFGTLIIRSVQEEHFGDFDLDVLKIFGSMASLAIRKAQLHAEREKALKIRDLFISMAAHELKTPLTAIHGYAQLLRSKMKDSKVPEAQWVENLLNETQRLTDLTNELLQIQTIKTGKLQFSWKECHLLEILQKVVEYQHFANPERKIDFENAIHENEDVIICDADKLFQVFDNVVDKAEKFSPKNKRILIHSFRDSENLVVEIVDRGSGVPKQDIPHIFDEFYKSGSNG